MAFDRALRKAQRLSNLGVACYFSDDVGLIDLEALDSEPESWPLAGTRDCDHL